MNEMAEFPELLFTIWWGGLVFTLVVLVPAAVVLLHRTWQAARSIERYAADALTAAGGIAGNTAHIPALDRTIEVASEMLDAAGAIDTKLDTIANVLAERAG